MKGMQDLRTYLKKLETNLPNQLVKVKEPVDWQYEVTSRIIKAEKTSNNPALLFENIRGYKQPIITNVFGSIDRIQLGLGESEKLGGGRLAFYEDWNKLFTKDVSPVIVPSGPIKEIVKKGAEVDFLSLPVPKFYEQDGGRYITAGLLTARNPEKPMEVNLSFVRMQVKDRNTLGISLHSRGHMWQYYDRARASGNPLEVAVIIGAHPALYLAAAAKITDEYSKAGALIGEPIELVRCETVDVPVPSHAEIVLEGHITLEEEEEGPFTEYTGYISGRSTRNQLKLSAITMRRDAIFQAVAPSNSSEHLLLSGLPKQARISKALIDYSHASALNDIIWPVWGTHFVCFLSLKRAFYAPGLAKQIALLLLGLDHYVKIVVVLPPEIDVSDVSQVLTTVADRCNFIRGSGVEILGGVYSHMLDPSSPEGGLSSKMILDATEVVLPTQINVNETNNLTVQDMRVATLSDTTSRVCFISDTGDKLEVDDIIASKALDPYRLLVVVDEDIEIKDPRQVLWAIATRFQPDTGTTLSNARMVIDARKGDNWVATMATLPKK
jgi:2,5-furandicarboxylate decarboxylase 1